MDMEKIDRYTQSVSSNIPENQRFDFEKELKRDICLILAERLGSKEPTDADIDLVLEDLGDSSRRVNAWVNKNRLEELEDSPNRVKAWKDQTRYGISPFAGNW
jgi:exoribonuclease R